MKKKLTMALSAFICLALLFTALPMTAFAALRFAVGSYDYVVTDDVNKTAAIVDVTMGVDRDSIKSLSIPSEVTYNSTKYSITSVGNQAFMSCTNLSSLTIPTSVTKIGSSSFTNTALTSVVIPSSVQSIGETAFSSNSKLNSVTINNSSMSIGMAAFKDVGTEASPATLVLPDNWPLDNYPDSSCKWYRGYFKPTHKRVKLTSNVEGCTVTTDKTVVQNSADGTARKVTVTASPTSDYLVDTVSVSPNSITLTDNKNGTYSFTMPVDGNDFVVTVSAKFKLKHTHTLTKIDGKPATCTEAGSSDVWKCSGCNKYFEDSNGNTEIGAEFEYTLWKLSDALKYPPSHTYGTPTYSWTDDSCTATRTCSVCAATVDGHTISETKKGTYAKDTDATCTDAEKGHYAVTFNDTQFGSAQTAVNSVTGSTGALGHTPKAGSTVAATTPTCEEDGCKEYAVCDRCGKYIDSANALIGDAAALTSWKAGDGKNPSLGHKYGDWEKYDEKQHKHVCTLDDTHIEYEDHTWDAGTITTQPTDTADGVKTFTCTACGETKTEPVSMLKILDGDNSTYTLKSGKKISMRCSGEFSLFTELQVDGKTLTKGTDYTATEGSTIIKFAQKWLDKQKPGKYPVLFKYSDGRSCKGTLIIAAKSGSSPDDQPKTGYNNNLILWVILIALSGLLLAWSLIWMKNRGMFAATVSETSNSAEFDSADTIDWYSDTEDESPEE